MEDRKPSLGEYTVRDLAEVLSRDAELRRTVVATILNPTLTISIGDRSITRTGLSAMHGEDRDKVLAALKE